MKSIIVENTGNVEVLKTVEVERPLPGKGEVLVEVKALGVNPVDFKVRRNEAVLNMIYGEERPAVLGWDLAGTVVAIGEGASHFKVGDRVFGMVNFPGAGKAYAEYVAAPEAHLSLVPADTTFEEAAASTLAALTALQVLQGKVKANDRVLVHAGSGGVGHFAIQIAKSMGAYVISTSSAANKDFVTSLGADEHVDYRAQRFEEVLSDIDFVFDMFNGDILHKSVQLVKPGGTVVSIPSGDFTEEVQELAASKNVNLLFHMVQSSGDEMKALASMLEKGTLTPHISHRFAFDEMAKAHTQLESGRTVGKVVVTL